MYPGADGTDAGGHVLARASRRRSLRRIGSVGDRPAAGSMDKLASHRLPRHSMWTSSLSTRSRSPRVRHLCAGLQGYTSAAANLAGEAVYVGETGGYGVSPANGAERRALGRAHEEEQSRSTLPACATCRTRARDGRSCRGWTPGTTPTIPIPTTEQPGNGTDRRFRHGHGAIGTPRKIFYDLPVQTGNREQAVRRFLPAAGGETDAAARQGRDDFRATRTARRPRSAPAHRLFRSRTCRKPPQRD